jgi:hypothetical protein
MTILRKLRNWLGGNKRVGALRDRTADEMAAGSDHLSDAGVGGQASFPPGYFPKQDDGRPRT